MDTLAEIRRDEFPVRIYYNNQEYTPQQVRTYIRNTTTGELVDTPQIQALIRESEGKFQTSVKKHNLTMEQRLQAETSPAGRELAELALSHCDAKIGLITQ